MTSEFEIWLKANEGVLHEDARGLFIDSVRCLKNDIERPAYLLAYQGMMVTIREALKAGEAPQGFTPGEWTAKLAPISREEAWDTAVFNLIQQKENKADPAKPKDAPLHMSDAIRDQFAYWRILRNNCAHYKKDPLLKAHVISLYSFISTQLLNITVTGGADKMLDKLKTYLDPTKTPAGTSLNPWIEEASRTVADDDLPDFLDRMLKMVAGSYKSPERLINSIFLQDGPSFTPMKEELRKIVKANTTLLTNFLGQYPEYILDLLTEKTEIREFWKTKLSYSFIEPLPIVAKLLIAGKIPEDEKEELFSHMLNIFFKDKRWVSFKEPYISVLTSHGYFDLFKSQYFNSGYVNNSNHVADLCYRTDFLISHLTALPLTAENINLMIDIVENKTPYPYTLRDRFRKLSTETPDFHARLKEAAHKHSISLPPEWQ